MRISIVCRRVAELPLSPCKILRDRNSLHYDNRMFIPVNSFLGHLNPIFNFASHSFTQVNFPRSMTSLYEIK